MVHHLRNKITWVYDLAPGLALDETWRDHEMLVEAIGARDSRRSGQLMRAHVDRLAPFYIFKDMATPATRNPQPPPAPAGARAARTRST